MTPKGKSIDKEVYCDFLDKMGHQLGHGPLREVGAHNRNKRYFFLQDGAPPHTSNMAKAKIASLNLELLPHPSRSCDLAPTDFHINRALKNFLMGKCFESENELREVLGKFFKDKFTPKFCAKGMMKLPDRWHEIMESGGCYIAD